MEQVNEQQVMKKIFWRLTPLMVFLYIVSYLDRVNVGFAALTMNKDIGLNAYTYGLGAGIFFWGYFIFEIPSNLIMAKVGARRWIARILFSWGLVAVAMAWVKGPASFLTMRFILGVAEAGFFPGVILYWTYWFPARYRARPPPRLAGGNGPACRSRLGRDYGGTVSADPGRIALCRRCGGAVFAMTEAKVSLIFP